MASMKPISIYVTDKETDERIDFKSSVSVDSEGVFHCTIPEFLQESADQLIKHKKQEKTRLDLYLSKPRDNWRVSGSTLQTCVDFMREAVKNYLIVEKSIELIIIYKIKTDVCFCKGADGNIYPNGSLAKEVTGEYEWFEKDGLISSSQYHDDYSVGINAAVVEKVTYKRKSGDKIVYQGPEGEGNTNLGDGYLLNNWARLKTFNFSGGLSGDFEEMPYTPQAEMFFHETIKTLCSLADRFSAFFGEKETLIHAIKTGTKLLIGKGE